ncbi:MAG: hypothetical protein JXA00_04260 [Candidatus Thermoplasmatota archaeon]|nr:hypothetical protein [Candidatus Thermoplasmatota archaeon]
MRKNLVIIVGILLVLSSVSLVAARPVHRKDSQGKEPTLTPLYEDVVDQNQSVQVENISMPLGQLRVLEATLYIQVAQSFIPAKDILTRVELLVGKNTTTTYPFMVGVRDNLTHENLVETSLPASAIPTTIFDWVGFDFDDLAVTPGETYYIVTYTMNATDNWYAWAANNQSESYPYGCAWASLDNGTTWNQSAAHGTQEQQHTSQQGATPAPRGQEDETGDMCFRTYGIAGTILEILPGGNFISPSFIIKNVGNETAWDVEWEISVTGGILGGINYTTSGSASELLVGDELAIKLGMLLLGFGRITLTMSARALNAPEVTFSREGILLLFFVIWR